jgi:hypothetical protein
VPPVISSPRQAAAWAACCTLPRPDLKPVEVHCAPPALGAPNARDVRPVHQNLPMKREAARIPVLASTRDRCFCQGLASPAKRTPLQPSEATGCPGLREQQGAGERQKSDAGALSASGRALAWLDFKGAPPRGAGCALAGPLVRGRPGLGRRAPVGKEVCANSG